MCKFRKVLLNSFLILILPFFLSTPSFAGTYRWEDFSRPFIKNIWIKGEQTASRIEVHIPDDIIKSNSEIVLIVTAYDVDPQEIATLHVNDSLWKGWYHLKGRDEETQECKINIKTKHLRPGINILNFGTEGRWAYRISKLRFEIPNMPLSTISITSIPSGADVYLNASYRGTTPTNIKLSRGLYNIRLEKDGYGTLRTSLSVYEDRDYSYALERKEVVDTEPPEIKISSPIDNFKTIKEEILLKGRITDNIKVGKLRVTRDDEVLHHDKDLLTFQEKTGSVFILDKGVKLNAGRNDIIVEATDQAGNKAREFLAVYRIEPVAEEPTKMEKIVTLPKIGKYYAVVIGIGKHQDDRIPKLKYTTVDAESIYNILTDPQHGNFPKNQVKLLIDEQATDNNIKSAIGTWLRRNTRKDDTVIIFFAGHGAPEDEKTYWVTYNANIDDLYGTALSNDEIADMLDRVEAKKMIAFLDSCYSAATVHRTDRKRGVIIVKDPFQKFKGKGRVVITSSDGEEQSLEIDKFGHGVFTYHLAKALKGEADENKDGYVELDEVWDYIKYRVTDTARRHGSSQTPIIDGSYSAGIVLSKHPERLRELELEAEREKKEKELESKIAKLTELYSKGELTDSQFDKAVKILESGEKNKLLEKFLSDKISVTTFKRAFK